MGVEFGAPKAGALPKADTRAVRDMYSDRLGHRPRGKRVNALRSISRHGFDVSARAASRRKRKSMAPVFVAGAKRVFAPGLVSLFKVRTDGS